MKKMINVILILVLCLGCATAQISDREVLNKLVELETKIDNITSISTETISDIVEGKFIVLQDEVEHLMKSFYTKTTSTETLNIEGYQSLWEVYNSTQ
jgi:hypothetical protein